MLSTILNIYKSACFVVYLLEKKIATKKVSRLCSMQDNYVIKVLLNKKS